ncbi:hypothetical protein PXK30_09475 [Phaeobacter gallaeciensis]|jgi:hypothetical protein|uniref:hypothetical protein n=1 Tax=Phaeobacter gallaeciensis TaxID=60890 RepID=UPI00237F0A66|nr:hypothetical protein [Phaeobacter gallaeciensis]MDE4303648.1 hypothetical protein [Phaeobacter gallaeciensis]MDE4307871.1 hypothetical protein [Phaeobacter gallaeciensis]MDE4312329.1 hypothetical protein [Phaeobacter gallaeciensis]MDE4316800.1 hypothetical protein [Phaeobacter gallaeciensis]MDE4321263.1 hypothetical protein [Phaeobacter gallaeciensis]
MRRRDFIAGSITIPALGASIAAAAVVRDPHHEWFSTWRKCREFLEHVEDDSPEEDAAIEQTWELDKKLANTRAETASGALVQLEWVLADSSSSTDFQPGHHEAISLAVKSLRALS